MKRDKDLPERAFRLSALGAVLNGKHYDHLPQPFYVEKAENGDYVPLHHRRPSVRTNLCRVVVDDAVSLLFSEGHFPTIQADSDATKDALAALVKARHLNALMIDLATRGAVGSVCLLLRVLKGKLFFQVLDTPFLTPEWDPADPDVLLRVTERYKVAPQRLAELGYTVDPAQGDHWFQRMWDATDETWFIPWPVKDTSAVPRVDLSRSVTHGLGFLPMIWVRNLPGGDDTDGECTFRSAIDTVCEADYLLSQAGRGLKYASDPTLVIKDPSMMPAPRVGGAANALNITAPEGDAKLLEINGTAAAACREHVEALRHVALEQMHGNRTNADKISAATSGRAMELMTQGLIWLADRMRISYGEGALLSLLRMVCRASAVVAGGVWIGSADEGQAYTGIDPTGLSLKWPDWYAPTHTDKQAAVAGLVAARQGGIMSRETAVAALAPVYDVEDADAELTRILADEAAQDARMAAQAAATTAAEQVSD